ncbi:MAG: hypothetical protein V7746_20140 [Halioglobus sp.]
MKIPTYQFVAQMGAAFAVVASLALVVYEVRENTKINFQQEVSGSWSSWVELSMAEVESGISHKLAKAMTNAEELTLAEKIDLDSYLVAHVSIWMRDYDGAVLTGGRDVKYAIEEIVRSAPGLFGNEFSRGWYMENKFWIPAEIVRDIDELFLSTPLGSDIAYYERIGSHYMKGSDI